MAAGGVTPTVQATHGDFAHARMKMGSPASLEASSRAPDTQSDMDPVRFEPRA